VKEVEGKKAVRTTRKAKIKKSSGYTANIGQNIALYNKEKKRRK